MVGACSTYGGEERCIQSFDGKPEGKRPLGKPTRRWEGNIKMDFREVGWGGDKDWIDVVQKNRGGWRALVNAPLGNILTS